MGYGDFQPGTGKYVTDQDKIVNVLDRTGGISMLETKHHYIHTGRAFYMDFYDLIGSGSVFYFYGKNTSTDKAIHLQPPHFDGKLTSGGTDATFLIEFIEGATNTNLQETVPLTSLNVNRGSSNQAAFKVYPQSTQAPQNFSTTGGTVFAREYRKPTNQVIEWIIPPGGSYLAKFTNLESAQCQYFLRLFWYEAEI